MYLKGKERLSRIISTAIKSGEQTVYKTKRIYPIANALVGNAVYEGYDYTNKNFGAHPYTSASSWTYQGTKGDVRSLILFQMNAIPSNIISAKLNLFGAGHDPLTASNACYVQRITSFWDEKTVTWNTQPTVTGLSKKIIKKSSFAYQNYIVDITNWVKRWKSELIVYGLQNYGIMIRLQEEDYYAKMQFGSGKYSNWEKRPYILIDYKI